MAEIKINERIAYLRKLRGVTQEEPARRLGVTNRSVSKWESGACCPDIQLLPERASYFGVTVDELLGCDAASSEGSAVLNLLKAFAETQPERALPLAAELGVVIHNNAVAVRCGVGKSAPDARGNAEITLHVEPNGSSTDVPSADEPSGLCLSCSPAHEGRGLSACSEPEGASAHVSSGYGDGVFFFKPSARLSLRPSDVRAVSRQLGTYADIGTLRTFFALYELCADNFDDKYVAAAEIAARAKLDERTALAALAELPVEESGGGYRIEGACMHLPPLLLMLCDN